jgi:hypothetical protein
MLGGFSTTSACAKESRSFWQGDSVSSTPFDSFACEFPNPELPASLAFAFPRRGRLPKLIIILDRYGLAQVYRMKILVF